MDNEYELNRTLFVWNTIKCSDDRCRHGVEFTDAASVFDDPLMKITEAGRNGECRDKAIGFSSEGTLLSVIHVEHEKGESVRIISAWPATAAEEALYDQ
jgi:hypothetical protein